MKGLVDAGQNAIEATNMQTKKAYCRAGVAVKNDLTKHTFLKLLSDNQGISTKASPQNAYKISGTTTGSCQNISARPNLEGVKQTMFRIIIKASSMDFARNKD